MGKPHGAGGRLVGLLDGWRDGSGPLHRRLAGRVVELLSSGRLEPGTQLPSQRALAEALSVGRGTVGAAYAALRERGLADRDGWLAPSPAPPAVERAHEPAPPVDLPGDGLDRAPEMAAVVGALGGGDWAELIADDRALGGLRALRSAIAGCYQALGLPTGPEEVVVTTGIRAALELVSRLFLEPGAAVAIEEPTSPVALDAFRSAGALLLPVAVDQDGVRPSAVRRRLEEDAPRLLYLTPTGHPLARATMPPARRRGIAALAGVFKVPVVEDGTRVDPRPVPGTPPPLLAAFARGAPVLSLGGMGEPFWPELRVGWIRAPAGTAEALAHLQAEAGASARPAAQFLAAKLLAHPPPLEVRTIM